MQTYSYRHVDWRPGARLKKPLADSKIAVVTSAAFYCSDQQPFDQEMKGGDYSFREIPDHADVQTLMIGHRSEAFDHSGIERDKNLALPLEPLQDLQGEGKIGSVSKRHFSLMGSITAPARLIASSGPEIASKLLTDAVDAVLLTPV
jgi:D-proline reductase (dithiol) PrdB